MPFLFLLSPLLLLILNTTPIFAVTCLISRRVDSNAQFARGNEPMPKMCMGLQPGACCVVPPDPEFDELFPKKRVQMSGLGPLDIASVFSAEPPNTGCTGRSIATYAGGGNWDYEVPADDNSNITGACYMRVPQGEPTEGDKAWLEGEGALAFFTGNSQWVSRGTNGPAAQSIAAKWGFGTMSGTLPGLPPRIKRLGRRVVDMARMNMRPELDKREIISQNKGLILFEGPKKIAWADTIEVDGVLYTAETPQSQVFVSTDGKVLNYTKPAS
ncbi:MAG: hypothetical protein Q9166_007872 [cf. Caloplaca sp. 2 TL-2023]